MGFEPMSTEGKPPGCSFAGMVYVRSMKTILMILVGLGMIATLGTLLAGMAGLTNAQGNPERSNRLMRWRVILQGATLLLFVLLMAVSR
jgi:hypothetical protein